MNDNIKKLLKAAGYSDDTLKAVAEDKLPEDFDIEVTVSELEETNKKRHFELFKNDEGEDSFRAHVIRETDGKWSGILNADFKKHAGLGVEDTKDMTFHEKLKLAMANVRKETEEKYKGDNKDVSKEIEELQAKNLELINEVTDIKEERDTKVKAAEDNAITQIMTDKASTKLKTAFVDVPTEQLMMKSHPEGIFLSLKAICEAEYDTIEHKETGIEFVMKGTSQRVTGKTDSGQEIVLPYKDVILNKLGKGGLDVLVESGGQGGGGNNDNNNDGGNDDDDNKKVKFTDQRGKIKESLDKFKVQVPA